jgi:flagellar biogenesis protein FliO
MNAGLPRMAAVRAFVSLLAMLVPAAVARSADQIDDGRENDSPAAVHPTGLDDPWLAVEPEFPEHTGHPLARRSTARESPVLPDKGQSSGLPWARTLGALAGVVGLIVFLAWGYRAMAAGHLSLLGKPRRPGLIEVITKAPLSARQSLCLVRIGSRLVLIGQSHETLRALDVIDDADLVARLAGEAAGRRPDSRQAEFHACLEREAGGYQMANEDVDETLVPDARRIADVRHAVTDTIRRVRRALTRP